MDGLKFLLRTLLVLVILCSPLTVAAQNIPTCNCPYHLAEENPAYIGNGRTFQRTTAIKSFETFDAQGRKTISSYPLFVDHNGVEAYFEGMLVLEMRHIEDYQSALPWAINADETTHYYDLGISLITFSNPTVALMVYRLSLIHI